MDVEPPGLRTVEAPLLEARGGPVHTGFVAAALPLVLLAAGPDPDPEPLPLPLPLPEPGPLLLEAAAAAVELVEAYIDTEAVAGETKMAKAIVSPPPLDMSPADCFK